MLARLSRIQGSPDRIDRAVPIFQESTDQVQQLPGFEGAYLLVAKEGGQIVTLTLWNSESDMNASAQTAEDILARAAERAGSEAPPQIETYEVLLEV